MKKLGSLLIALVVVSTLFMAFTFVKAGSIIGRFTPTDAVASISLVAGTDTVKALVDQGTFTFTNLKEGVYNVSIKAIAPYKDTTIANVAVKDSTTTEMGEIKLLQ